MGKSKTSTGKPKGQQGNKTAVPSPAAPTSLLQTAVAQNAPPPPPRWPRFKPPLPVTDLTPLPLESCPDRVVLIHNFWPKSLCSSYVSFLKGLPLVTTPGRPKRGEAVRVNDRYQVEDPVFARRLWLETGLLDALQQGDVRDLWGGELVGLSPNIRVYRYLKGQYFDAHYDDSNNVLLTTDPAHPPVPCKTTWTLLLYLTTSADGDDAGCSGGQTVFFPNDRRRSSEEIAVPPQTGLLLLHKHGDDCMLHEGREVTAGEKWVLRTDLCVRK
ncbi:hypothetical protein SODALDRAFT_83279 [Sodiomyces alkalinus F11]|uniref:Fe2OG dioxygenase domain-containing protein n=1 Tax=Sodiomyces alkalinus (strain CBS 110278 / VKM F-3762 / F11) TaxID=1314773 RepID=A0A3N2PJK5_SODAK|nr:hypothetical protein SODALDRAFT_83279 [Sodiomyces alkalinus F11]ROT34699.1 hypothetical protein SODALDRAFT_83279 [Sodiomyces alkalinus F11]